MSAVPWSLPLSVKLDASSPPLDTGEEWYIDADQFDAVYAIGDLHGDVGAAVAIFRDLIGAVQYDPTVVGQWKWVRERCAVVVLGDVVDRARIRGVSTSGENRIQEDIPDDLYLLRLLNHWSDLADAIEKTHG
jgi:hypothetical protein